MRATFGGGNSVSDVQVHIAFIVIYQRLPSTASYFEVDAGRQGVTCCYIKTKRYLYSYHP